MFSAETICGKPDSMVSMWYVGLVLLAATTDACVEPDCMIGCSRVTGPDNCPICECTTTRRHTSASRPPTCKGIKCGIGQECIFKTVDCYNPPCSAEPTCVRKNELQQPNCTSPCTKETTADGCPICLCPRGCPEIKCMIGYHRETNPDTGCPMCVRNPTTEEKKTTAAPHVCPMFRCGGGCTTIFGSDGCPGGCDCPPTTSADPYVPIEP